MSVGGISPQGFWTTGHTRGDRCHQFQGFALEFNSKTLREMTKIIISGRNKKKYLTFLREIPYFILNPLTPNDLSSVRTAPLTSKRCNLYIYSTNRGNEYFKHGIYSPFFFSSKRSLFHNSNVFGSCFIHILYTVCAKI